MKNNRLIIPTLKGFSDSLTPMLTAKRNEAVLFNPEDDRYSVRDGVLYFEDKVVERVALNKLVSNSTVNKPIGEIILVYGILSYLRYKRDLKNNTRFEVSVSDVSNFFSVTMGVKGFQLVKKLESLCTVYGVLFDIGVYPLLEVAREKRKLVLTSLYLHKLWNLMQERCAEQYGSDGLYFTNLAHASLVAAKDKRAALVVIELIRLFVRAGQDAHVSMYTLVQKIPQIREITATAKSTSSKNRDLKRIFLNVYRLLESKTSVKESFKDLVIDEVIPTLKEFNTVLHMSHQGWN